MKHIVIVGGGPVGLYLAIRLARICLTQDLQITITVVEPKLGSYNRPGIVARNVLKDIQAHVDLSKSVLRDGDDTGSSIFIMELEMALYQEAQKLPIHFKKAKVVGLSAGQITLSDKSSILCDGVLDCTGSRRAIVMLVNKIVEPQPFALKQVADNPIKNHFVAYVKLDAENASAIMSEAAPDALEHTLALEHLRTEFQWPEFIEPELSIRKYTPNTRESKLLRHYFYYEIPPKLAEAEKTEQIAWLRALIKLKTGNDHIEFEIEEGAMKFIPFDVNPHKVTEPIFMGDPALPMIIAPCGDAQIDPDYRRGMGIKSGVSRADAFIAACSFTKQSCEIEPRLYHELLKMPLGEHETTISGEYLAKKRALQIALVKEQGRYTAALTKARSEGERMIIQSGLAEIHYRIALHAFHVAADDKTPGQSIRKIKVNRQNKVSDETALGECEQAFLLALTPFPGQNHARQEVIKADLLDLAKSYKDLAGASFKNRDYVQANKYYKKSLALLTSHFEEEQLEAAKILSNLAIVAKNQAQYKHVKHYCARALEALGKFRGTASEIDSLTLKIQFTQCTSLLSEIQQNKGGDARHLSEKFEEAQQLYKQITAEKTRGEFDFSKLTTQFVEVSKQMEAVQQTLGKPNL